MNERDALKAAEIRARLRTAGGALPESLREEAFGTHDDPKPPSLVIESAEGITTFPGIDRTSSEDPETVEHWFERARDVLADRSNGESVGEILDKSTEPEALDS